MKALSRIITSVLIASIGAVSADAQIRQAPDFDLSSVKVEFSPSPSPYTTTSIRYDISVVSAVDARKEASRLAHLSDDTTILSTDDENVLVQDAIETSHANKKENRFFLLPVVKVARQIGKNIKDDKIGFMMVTYNLGWETVRWIHASNLTDLEKSANVTYSVVTALVFSLNKDVWAKATKPVQRGLRQVLGMSSVLPEKAGPADIGVKYAANFLISAGVSLGRVPLLNLNNIANGDFKISAVNTPLLIALVYSMAGMGWSEFVASIDQTTNPKAKFAARRMIEMRSLTTGMLASTAMLLNYNDYGVTPWISVAVSGTVGLVLYLNSSSIVKWIESSPTISRLASMTKASHRAVSKAATQTAKMIAFPTLKSKRPVNEAEMSCRKVIGG